MIGAAKPLLLGEGEREGVSSLVYVVVCRGPHAREHGSLPLRKRLAQLLGRAPNARLIGYACFGQCDHGPNVAFYPEGEWYGGLNTPGSAERVARHALDGEPLDA